jgi:hypothetical protein
MVQIGSNAELVLLEMVISVVNVLGQTDLFREAPVLRATFTRIDKRRTGNLQVLQKQLYPITLNTFLREAHSHLYSDPRLGRCQCA